MRFTLRIALAVVLLSGFASGSRLDGQTIKLDPLLQLRATLLTGQSRVVVTAASGVSISTVRLAIQLLGGTLGRTLDVINGTAATLPNAKLSLLAANGAVKHVALDRVIAGANERTGPTVGATAIRQQLGVDGTGVTVAVIDSGINAAHDDFADPATGLPRVARFVDFVNNIPTPYDDYGHGTHVAGIIAGNGADSGGLRAGIAPSASIVALKVLDGSGSGRISDVIAALDYVVSHQSELNIRVVNLSVATGVYESYDSDPLTQAAKQAVNAGVVVVASAGNAGRNQQGQTQHGGITAPGNAPWVLTVGASSHMGTIDRSDDTMAAFSSRGPTAIDGGVKPDLVAPGVGIESTTSPDSTLYNTKAAYLLPGTTQTSYVPYLSLSGTSQAAPVVAGTVALMLQANPSLTPNAVKAVLQYTAQVYPAYDPMTEGAGFLNAAGAVSLANFLASPATVPFPDSTNWSGQIIWAGNRVSGGLLTADANAWSRGVDWGAMYTTGNTPIGWGVRCASDCDTGTPQWIAWQTNSASGTSSDGDTVVWGTSGDGDTVVWGTSNDGDTVVWGTSCSDSSCEPVVWQSQ
jgi:serine protease AprX